MQVPGSTASDSDQEPQVRVCTGRCACHPRDSVEYHDPICGWTWTHESASKISANHSCSDSPAFTESRNAINRRKKPAFIYHHRNVPPSRTHSLTGQNVRIVYGLIQINPESQIALSFLLLRRLLPLSSTKNHAVPIPLR